MLFGCRSRHIPRKAEVESERRRNSPVILDEGPVNLPAAAGHGAVVGLVMFAQSGHAHQQVRFGIARGNACTGEVSEEADDPEAILEGFSSDVHLVGAKIDARVKFMLAADQVEIVLERKDVRSTLK